MKNLIGIEFYKVLAQKIYWVDGIPYWRNDYSETRQAHTEAGHMEHNYRKIPSEVDGVRKNICAHRLRWFMYYDEIPKMLDHINRDRDDNRIENLRRATSRQNGYNRTKWRGNSKYKGVHWCKRDKKWRAILKVEGISRSIGYHNTEDEAGIAYDSAVMFHNLQDYVPMNFIEYERQK